MKVRICCAVDENGKWNATGYLGQDDEDTIGTTLDCLDSDLQYRIFWIEANVELPPKPTTVKGETKEHTP
jgi:hypothetical protein